MSTLKLPAPVAGIRQRIRDRREAHRRARLEHRSPKAPRALRIHAAEQRPAEPAATGWGHVIRNPIVSPAGLGREAERDREAGG